MQQPDLLKICIKCDSEFSGIRCKICKINYRKIYNEENKEKIAKKLANYYKNNKESIAIYQKKYNKKNKKRVTARNRTYHQINKKSLEAKAKVYRQKNKKQIQFRKRIYENKRRKTDTAFRISGNLRSRLSNILRNKSKIGSAVRDLGCTGNELKAHLESLFQLGMSWDNYGMKDGQWSIDHIIPLSKVDLSDRNAFLKVNHYTNLQPMWHIDNLIKGNKTK